MALHTAAPSPPAVQERRRRRSVRAHSAPSHASPVQLQPLTKADFVENLRSGCKPKECWRIGTEHEKFGFRTSDRRPMDYDQVRHILDGLVARFAWNPIMEGEFIIGAERDQQSVTLEPGGQLELSGAPVSNLHQTAAELESHLTQVKTLAAEVGVSFLGLGFQPLWQVSDVPAMPKGRYKIMREYMPKVGTMGLDMMFRTCTVQVNLDFSSEPDMVDKFRISLALQPVATALFANSPFVAGQPSGFRSYRSNVWTDVDAARCGDLPFVFHPGFGFEAYVDWVLSVPMYFVYRDGRYIDASGQSFRDFVTGKLTAMPGVFATMADWEAHCTTAFPEVRLKRWLEMRGADNGCSPALNALPALWVGLLYDEQAQAAAAALVADWTEAERAGLRAAVPRSALATPFRDGTVLDIARAVVAIARGGLERRVLGEEQYLAPLEDICASGVTAADAMLAEFDGSVDSVFSKYTY